MGLKRMDLIHSIADTIKDYREREIDPINANHVARWIGQFNYLDQLAILTEMDSILKRFYLSRGEVKQRLYALLLSHMPTNEQPAQALARARFLSIQKKGESQRELLGIMDEVLQEKYAIKLAQCGEVAPTSYIYIDDAIYTGNRLRYDLTAGNDAVAWIPRLAPVGCKLFIFALAFHAAGFSYAYEQHIKPAAQAKQIDLSWACTEFIENIRNYENKFECLWPNRSTTSTEEGGDPDAVWYSRYLIHKCQNEGWPPFSLTRLEGVPVEETLFSSPAARNQVELAFFKAGAQIIKTAQVKDKSFRPLGFEVQPSWGFGSLFITYRNIANNCPLALWWKSEGSYSGQTKGWYPLFPRRVNQRFADLYTDEFA